MTRYAVVLLAVALASAGCIGFGGSQQAMDGARPPGTTADGLNATALVAAHERSLAGRTVGIETTRAEWATLTDSNRTVRTRTVTDGNGTLRREARTETADGTTTVELWADGDGAVRHVGASGRTVPTESVTTPRERYRTGPLERWLAAGTYELTTVERGREPRCVFVATAYTPPDGEPMEADTVQFEATAIVTPTGRVRALSATLVTVERNKWGRHARTRTYSYRLFRPGGAGPERPAWLGATAPNVEGRDG